ncbi:RDD domain protein [Sulfitobacter noctilucicola]|uniref:Putative RDD family membrane protein YckC n=1 Tax=Sulfitobacter noctilucicola TaxID=1342301 RepID=A0A7W6MBL3_9RHOB|nr:RDD family protein [Sulfitobacter noctilucicola]KIN66420.1 RDD domain protein [Sulfitobacter noctilucicola]MBB4175767.1 putative RDD family membrane protein YckC [Sulfitobacter noctilucicola]
MTPDPATDPHFYQGIPSKRLLAWCLDTVLIVVLCIMVLPFTVFTGLFFFPFLMMVVGFIYRCATLASGSATWGMRLMSMEIRQGDDRPLSGGMAILHTVGYSVSLAMPLFQLISVVLMLTSERKQGLTDMILGTVAMNRRL